ncbi:50S ribosomal protein L11 methyltransferase [Amphibiibacter pelophylacis]|uniref:50S ribosomal protein L11 methyltransferase n=1 Tax=Amphibiibacter pelophylacis TaxID=1799477 RepID=A0ACC6P2L2_9BURK
MHTLTLQLAESLVEPVGDALMDDLDALSVSVIDAQADSESEIALFGEPDMPAPAPGWALSALEALFDTEADAQAAAAWVLAQFPDVRLIGIDLLPDNDWVRLSQAQFQPVQVTPSFWVTPSWSDAPDGAQTLLRLDPGLAFGTGSHPTTLMCLRWLARSGTDHPGALLDYGCGSGILAIGAGLLAQASGQERLLDGVDIDPAAWQATQDNAAANGVAVRAGGPDILTPGQRYPVVLANILASPLKLLAPLLCGRVAPGGRLVLAGILERQTAELQAAYAPWMDLVAEDTLDGWVLLTGSLRD